MKRVAASVLTCLGIFAACTPEEPETVGDTGVSGTTGAGAGGTAGAGMNGGSSGAGLTGGTAGSGATGGTAGSGATGGTAGSGATGGTAGGQAGAGNAGGQAGAGNTGGQAGAGNAGGMAGGGAGGQSGGMGGQSGGMGGQSGGMGGAAGKGGGCPSVAELFPVGPVGQPAGQMGSLDGRLIQTPCRDEPNTDDCNSDGWIYNGVRTACTAANRLEIRQEFVVGGTPGTTYQVRMHFYGIMEPKIYQTVTREASNRPGDQNTGAMPTPWATCNTPPCTVPGGTYNSYEIHVMNNSGTMVGQYFLNADTQEPHKTYVINFEKTIPIIGGGRVRMYTTDGNCRQIKNCGSTAGFPCASKARSLPEVYTAAMPAPTNGAPPAGLSQPGLGKAADHSGQWFLTDVVAVTCM